MRTGNAGSVKGEGRISDFGFQTMGRGGWWSVRHEEGGYRLAGRWVFFVLQKPGRRAKLCKKEWRYVEYGLIISL